MKKIIIENSIRNKLFDLPTKKFVDVHLYIEQLKLKTYLNSDQKIEIFFEHGDFISLMEMAKVDIKLIDNLKKYFIYKNKNNFQLLNSDLLQFIRDNQNVNLNVYKDFFSNVDHSFLDKDYQKDITEDEYSDFKSDALFFFEHNLNEDLFKLIEALTLFHPLQTLMRNSSISVLQENNFTFTSDSIILSKIQDFDEDFDIVIKGDRLDAFLKETKETITEFGSTIVSNFNQYKNNQEINEVASIKENYKIILQSFDSAKLTNQPIDKKYYALELLMLLARINNISKIRSI